VRVYTQPNALPIKNWAEDADEAALLQAQHLSQLPFAFKHVALMPDCHVGYGMPIGGVLATEDVVIPNAVGVDIGCGMLAMQFEGVSAESITRRQLTTVLGHIRELIPVGFSHHAEAQGLHGWEPAGNVTTREASRAAYQIGTLGGGNHFIELQAGDDNNLWAMIHSGSRNLGKQVADHYNRLAKEMNQKWWVGVPPDWDLAYLPLDTPEGQAYVGEMQACVAFAAKNRQTMARQVAIAVEAVYGLKVRVEEILEIPHNYVAMENHFGKNVMVHRKGATRARAGELGIIPGSQGTASYIVEGLGNPQSFQSCSHGAGRKMGRKQAERTLSLQSEQERLDALGVVHSVRNLSDLDEAPGAYKDIDAVMAAQMDLVTITRKLKPLAVVKG